uniref:Disease resistance protein RGA3 n=1 Tax=Nelumbo nucifera TaxID=4432 RepID=A0A822YEA3_NELNU|nr:TPA_asm: hypothetical protein HUJ06_031047 [Nelumbo nucifera]
MDQLQLRLQEVLRGKLFLLILDDVWNEDEEKWDELRKYFMCGSRGSKILVTTRSYKVAEIMGTMVPYALSGLSDDVCWSLFRERAFRGGEEETNPNLVAIGKKIVKKCGGLPLAAKALGGLLRSFDRDERTWLSVLYDSNFPEDESEILPALKSSYNHLPSSIKQCFAYCAIFPKGYEIKKDVLIQLWIAQSFIHESCGRGIELEDIGNEYFNYLLMRCFFQDIVRDEYGTILRCKMHNLVHNLAQSVGRTECMYVDNENWIESIHRRVRHVSVVGDRKKVAEVFTPLHKAESLRTFLILHPYRLDTVDVPHNLSLRFKGLRVLDLHGTSIKKLPISISKLKHLRYLDLSDTLITKLPTSFTSLLNLQTLKLLHVRYLVELPRDLRKMISLRHLEFDGCSMVSEMPLRMGQLAGLQTLTKFIVGKEDGRTLAELQDLNSLRGQLRIESLENVSNAVDAVRANLKNKPNLCRLELCWGYFSLKQKVVEDVINRLQPHPNLKELSMEGYPGIQIPPWMMKGCSYCRLVKISLSRCLKWECLSPLGQLPDLKELSIVKMDGVRYIGNELFYPDDDDNAAAMVDAVIFPSLIKLEVSSMCNLEEWSLLGFEVDDQGGNRQQQVILPCLQSLSIKYCPKLTSLQLGHLASLKQFDITRCPNLNCIPEDSITSLSSLCRLYIPRCFTLLGGALRCLTALEELHVYEEPEMECLPESMKDLTKLERLEIWDCPKLGCLPEWIDRLVSLRALELEDVPNLRNLPAAIKHLKSLDSLVIKRCPHLQKQCKMRGPEWRKISHIKHVYI